MSILFNALRDTKIPDNFPKDIKITHSVQSILDQWQRLTTSTTSTDSKISRHRSDPKEIELFYLKSFTKVIVDENSSFKIQSYRCSVHPTSQDFSQRLTNRCVVSFYREGSFVLLLGCTYLSTLSTLPTLTHSPIPTQRYDTVPFPLHPARTISTTTSRRCDLWFPTLKYSFTISTISVTILSV